ncbi:ElyC/SanA/YdcF family protein [Marinilactibacillus piezotolerans]|uniref:ElyC/SanA/YdcF family protein n=1 Tax=Marinilactibacillus piezotolerans TaxID=258723 RepID=UPI0009AF73AD|nr:ElyC/SanA/YdcF family protein [Marinilactibacillus piezotolerans]
MIYILTLTLLVIFILSYLQDRRKVINGFFLTLFIISLYGSIAIEGLERSGSLIFWIFIVLTLLYAFLLITGGFLFVLFSILNTRQIYKKEGIKLKNSLVLGLGIGIVILYILSLFDLNDRIPIELGFLFSFAEFSILYVAFFLFLFLVTSLLYQVYFPKLDKDYIVILGSGLIDGYRVPPLLQSRIKKGVQFYQKQLAENQKKAFVIFSGGQGPDEKLSEAEAMADFACTLGLDDQQIILENQSKSTYENMKFSAQKMENPATDKAVFVTNNYHLLRAGIYAKRAGLHADGIGARTAFYFIPNAFIREFIAFMNLYRKYHLAILSAGLALSVILTITLFILQHLSS